MILEKIPVKVGDSIFLDKVLLVGSEDFTSVGRPYIVNAKVLCTVEEISRSEKVIIFKKKRRQGYQRNAGHRQEITVVRINKIIYEPNEEIISKYKYLF